MKAFWRRLHNGEASDKELVLVTVATLALALLLFILPMERVYEFLDSLIAWQAQTRHAIFSHIQ